MQRLPHSLKHLVGRTSTPQARNVVLRVMEQHKIMSTQELYKVVSEQPEQNVTAAEGSSDAELPIPSMRYLKRFVLPDLASLGKVEKVHKKEEISPEELEAMRSTLSRKGRKASQLPTHHASWRWQLAEPKPMPPPPVEEVPFGVEVGVGADVSHLNKRRRRAREVKVQKDVEWMEQLSAARDQARA